MTGIGLTIICAILLIIVTYNHFSNKKSDVVEKRNLDEIEKRNLDEIEKGNLDGLTKEEISFINYKIRVREIDFNEFKELYLKEKEEYPILMRCLVYDKGISYLDNKEFNLIKKEIIDYYKIDIDMRKYDIIEVTRNGCSHVIKKIINEIELIEIAFKDEVITNK